jgi:autotransporter translocation and assembly factor TamB
VAADLKAKGAPLSPHVEGTVDVHEGRLEVDRILEMVQTGLYSTEAIQSPSASTVPGAPNPATPAEVLASPANALSFDVQLRVPDNLVLRGSDVRVGGQGFSLGNMNLTVGGELHATRSADQPTRVVGEIRTVRGFYEFKGRRFDVLRDGTVSFTGPDMTDPQLNVTAQRDISGVQAQIRVHGTAQRPALDLSSTPPLDEADVLSLIVFNRPVNDLGQGERASLAQTAESLVGGMVAAPLAESLRGALDVDLLEIEAVSQNGGGPSVTIGNQLGERVFLQFRQLFGSAEATEVLLDYELSKYLRLQTSFTEGATDNASAATRTERGGVDLIFKVQK